MGRRKKIQINEDPFVREDLFVTEEGRSIKIGDLIKVKGIWGTKFKFLNYVTNPNTGVCWIDCIELDRGISCGYRSFCPNRVKHVPNKGGKRVKRLSKAS